MTLLPEGLGWEVLALLSAASFGTSMLTAALGIGGGVLLLGVMASLVPPAALIPVHGVVQLGSNAGRALVMARKLAPGIALPFALGSALGVAVGGAVAVELPPQALKIGVGVFVLWSVFFTVPARLVAAHWLSGAFSSVLTMFFGATGPFVMAHVKAQKLDREGIVATHAVLMVLQHGLKVAGFAALGFAFGPWVLVMAAMVATGFLGTLAGRQVLRRRSETGFRRALDVVLCLLAARLIWQGMTGG